MMCDHGYAMMKDRKKLGSSEAQNQAAGHDFAPARRISARQCVPDGIRSNSLKTKDGGWVCPTMKPGVAVLG